MDNNYLLIQIAYYFTSVVLLLIECGIFGYGFYKTKQRRWLIFLVAIIFSLIGALVLATLSLLMFALPHTFTSFYADNYIWILLISSFLGFVSQVFYMIAAIIFVRSSSSFDYE